MANRYMSPEDLSALIKSAAREAAAEVADRAGERAVEKLLLRLGVDETDKDAIPQLKNNLAYLNKQRQDSDNVKGLIRDSAGKVIMAVTGAAALWAVYVLKDGLHEAFVNWLTHPPR
jgi:hypothetical protein